MRSWRTSILQFMLALVLSLALWTYVSFTTNPSLQGEFEVPVTVTQPSDGLVVVDPATGQLLDLQVATQLQVTGPEADLDRWNTGSFRASADLSQLNAGAHDVPINVDLPRSARLRSLNPPRLTVRLEPEQSRTVPVEADLRGDVPFLFQDAPPTLVVREAAVKGPEGLLAQVARVVVPIDLQGRTTTFTDQRPLIAVDQDGDVVEGVAVEPRTTRFTVVVTPRVEVQQVDVAPRVTGQLPVGYRFDLDWTPTDVDVIATIPITGTLYTDPIDLTGRTESFTQTVGLDGLDPSVQVLTQEPIVVNVTISPVTQPYNLSLFVQLLATNRPENVDVALNPPGLTITVNGTAEQFQQLATTTVQGTVDLANYGPGNYTVPVAINLPPGLRIVGPTPTAAVTITPLPPTPESTPGG